MATINKPNVNIHVSISSVTIYIPPYAGPKPPTATPEGAGCSPLHILPQLTLSVHIILVIILFFWKYTPLCTATNYNPINKGPEKLSPTLIVPVTLHLYIEYIHIHKFFDDIQKYLLRHSILAILPIMYRESDYPLQLLFLVYLSSDPVQQFLF